MDNLFARIPVDLTRETFETLLEAPTVRIERIVSCGQNSPTGFWYDQEQSEWVVLLQGAATIRFEGQDKVVHLTPGDHLNIQPHQRHRVESTAANEITVWLAIHY